MLHSLEKPTKMESPKSRAFDFWRFRRLLAFFFDNQPSRFARLALKYFLTETIKTTRGIEYGESETEQFGEPFQLGFQRGNFTEINLKKIIEKTEKILRFPQFTVPCCCKLAYLHTLKGISDLNKAHKLFEEEKLSADRQKYQPRKRWLDSDFIVCANRPKLEEYENRIIMEPHTDELRQLSLLWANKRTKAAVYAIKAVTFSCFWPRGIPTAIEAFKSVLQLVQQKPFICTKRQKIDWLWSCAFNMSR